MSVRSLYLSSFLATVLVLPITSHVQAAVLTVGAGPGCAHPNIQAALNAAAASPGLDIIRVTMGDYLAQRLEVNDSDDVAIEGGFLECTTPVRAGVSTLDGQGANPPGPVISHFGAGRLTLSDINIRNGNATGANATYTNGGGLLSLGSGSLTVYRSLIHGNRAHNGGGLAAIGVSTQPKQVTLIGVGFNSNGATYLGGGVFARWVDLYVTGDEISYFAGNHADSAHIDHGGGALYAVDGNVTIDGGAPTHFPFMDSNWTGSNGGAIYFGSLTPGFRSLLIRNRSASAPVTIASNSAGRFGGAVYVRASSSGSTSNSAGAYLINAIVSDNQAPDGSAFYLYGNGSNNSNFAELAVRASAPGEIVPPCPAALRCNRVEGHFGQGATIVLEEGGSLGNTRFLMDRGHLVDNIAVNGGGLIYADGNVHIDNSVLANNDAGNWPLIENGGGNPTRIWNSTITGNDRVAPSVVRLTSSSDTLDLWNSIVFQPGAEVLHMPAGTITHLRNLLVGNGHGLANLAQYNFQVTTDPMFVNPGQGDFRLRLGSPAYNRWAPGSGVNVPTVDLLGASRPFPSGAPTPYDFGAYEYGAVVDKVFFNGFDACPPAQAPGADGADASPQSEEVHRGQVC